MVLEREQEAEKPPATVETELRGFSYMPETKVELNLQFIEGEELERTWKTARRQRLKEREQKIWDEFVQEQDVLSSVCKEDPYQFLEQLPESSLKELLEIELQKMKADAKKQEEKQQTPSEQQAGDGDSPRHAAVTFAEYDTGDDSDVIHLYDDEKDESRSGPEDEVLNDSMNSPPCTVRDRFEDAGLSPASPPLNPDEVLNESMNSPPCKVRDRFEDAGPSPASALLSPDKDSVKSTENVTNMIESSIYCAKVREVRMRIIEELAAIVESLELRDIPGIDPEDLVKMSRRSTEFCARFNRIHMYQLQRQIQGVKRNNSTALPFARHTQFQAQMVRIGSLHHNLLQSLQIFHKSFEQTAFVSESTDMLHCLLQVTREASEACRAVPRPHLQAASELYADDLLVACDKLDEVVNEYAAKITSYINSMNSTKTSRSSRSGRTTTRKKSGSTWSKAGPKLKSEAESRLSMYSLDTLKINLHPKSSSSKDNQTGGTSASRRAPAAPPHKSPRASRRPLMRAPGAGRGRGRLRDAGADVRTLVEAVGACTSSHMSREPSPLDPAPRAHDVKDIPPLGSLVTSPKRAIRSTSPKRSALKAAFGTAGSSQMQQNPVSKIKCVKKDLTPKQGPDQNTPRQDSRGPTPRERNTPRFERDGTPRDNTPSQSPRDAKDDPPRSVPETERAERERTKKLNNGPGGRCEVNRIVRQLCGGDSAGGRSERVSGAKNAQLLCISGNSPRQPSTPQLLRILEETIQKKVPKTFFPKPTPAKGPERFRLTFNIPERTADSLFRYRTKFVQHMLTSPMYANCAVARPWEVVGSISEQLLDELLSVVARDMQLQDAVQELYRAETN